jgi:hypothetical protein
MNRPQPGRRERTLTGDLRLGTAEEGAGGGWLDGDLVAECLELGDQPLGLVSGSWRVMK